MSYQTVSQHMPSDILTYNSTQPQKEKVICEELSRIIETHLKKTESKVWHRHPVWFIEGNPIVGYDNLKAGVRLMFWSGRDFAETELIPGKGRFKDAAIIYTDVSEINEKAIKRWLKKARLIQWDYKNIVKHKGKLMRLG
jgi:phosphomevalonate kinase